MPQFNRWDQDLDRPFGMPQRDTAPTTSVPVAAPPPMAVPDAGTWTPPTYGGPMAPSYQTPNVPMFDAGPEFAAPTYEQAMQEPGFEFRLKQGEQALQNSAAAKGVLRTGMTLKDILGYGQDYAAQEYKNVFDRARQIHDVNYQGRRDEYAPLLAQYQNQFGLAQDRGNQAFGRQWDVFNSDLENSRYQDMVIRDLFSSPTAYGG